MNKKRKNNIHMEAPTTDGIRRTMCGRQVAITTRDPKEVDCARCVIHLNIPTKK